MTTQHITPQGVLALMSGRVIAFRVELVEPAGGVAGALMLSQALYWQSIAGAGEWWWQTHESWWEQTRLTRKVQARCRVDLCASGILEEARRGMPAKLWYRVNLKRLAEVLSGDVEKGPPRPDDEGETGCFRTGQPVAPNGDIKMLPAGATSHPVDAVQERNTPTPFEKGASISEIKTAAAPPGSRAAGTNPRALGTNPKALGTNPKAVGTNPRARAMGTNPRAVAARAAEPEESEATPGTPDSDALDVGSDENDRTKQLAETLLDLYPHRVVGQSVQAPGIEDVMRALTRLGRDQESGDLVALQNRQQILDACREHARTAPGQDHRGESWQGLKRWLSSGAWRRAATVLPRPSVASAARQRAVEAYTRHLEILRERRDRPPQEQRSRFAVRQQAVTPADLATHARLAVAAGLEPLPEFAEMAGTS